MKNILALTVLLLMGFQGLSQDSLKISPIVVDGVSGVFAPEPIARKIAHKLEDGDLAAKELAVCDSVASLNDSTIQLKDSIILNLKRELMISDEQIEVGVEKESVLQDKVSLYEKDRKRLKRKRWVFGAVGAIIGFVVGVIVK